MKGIKKFVLGLVIIILLIVLGIIFIIVGAVVVVIIVVKRSKKENLSNGDSSMYHQPENEQLSDDLPSLTPIEDEIIPVMQPIDTNEEEDK